MKKKMKKLLAIVISGAMALSILFATSAFASYDNNYAFGFDISNIAGVNTTFNEGQYRDTADTNDSWKVQLVTSGEGSGTRTDFWMEDINGYNLSGTVNAYCGGYSGMVYRKAAYASAYNKTCYLTAENNNDFPGGYHVTGYWDEQTGLPPTV